MIENITINNSPYNISKDPRDFFNNEPLTQQKCYIAIDMMKDCLDYIYNLVKPHYPNAFKPELYISDSKEINAMAYQGKSIIIFSGLILRAMDFIEQKYTPALLKKYKVFQNIPHKKILSGLRVYFWRYVVLHELYHIWDKHSLWKKLYHFNESGELKQLIQIPPGMDLSHYYAQLTDNSFETEQILSVSNVSDKLIQQSNLTQQALELDADSSAVCMIINLMMRDIAAGRVSEQDKLSYIQTELGIIMGALATAFSIFDGNKGAKFERLSELEKETHPLPSIRMAYAEEIADACLNKYYPDMDELRQLESEWQTVIWDIEADFRGQVDMGHAFYLPAYTEKAQKHLCKLKHRLTDMHDTMKPLVLANFADKLEEDDMKFLPSSVWFTNDGQCTRNWTNPATGLNSAIRSDKLSNRQPSKKTKPFTRQHPKIGANDPCPCGSGKKFKKCCRGNGKFD